MPIVAEANSSVPCACRRANAETGIRPIPCSANSWSRTEAGCREFLFEKRLAQSAGAQGGTVTNPYALTNPEASRILESLGAMEGLPYFRAQGAPRRRWLPSRAAWVRIYPGILASGTIGIAAGWLSQHYYAPVMLFALLLGLAFHFLYEGGRCIPGIDFSSKTLLRIGVALLGTRITLSEISTLGIVPVATVIVAVTTTILLGAFAARKLGMGTWFGVLSGGAVGICGASAALAIASVMQGDDENERDTILVVVTVTALSTIAMVMYPLLVTALHLNHHMAGFFLGGTIHDVAQVVGAGYTISPETGDVATYVKLLRVTMLVPVVFSLAFIVRRTSRGATGRVRAPVPLFLIGFIALVLLGSTGALTTSMVAFTSDISRWCLVIAISALGMKTSLKDLVTVGWKPVGLMVGETLWIAGLVLTVVLVTR